MGKQKDFKVTKAKTTKFTMAKKITDKQWYSSHTGLRNMLSKNTEQLQTWLNEGSNRSIEVRPTETS